MVADDDDDDDEEEEDDDEDDESDVPSARAMVFLLIVKSTKLYDPPTYCNSLRMLLMDAAIQNHGRKKTTNAWMAEGFCAVLGAKMRL